jgi:hypothetical protein
MQTIKELTEANLGCWLDNHRGHYISRDAIQLAQDFGFIVGPSDQFVLDMYEDCDSLPEGVIYPYETVYELADEAVAWLNSSPTEREIPGQNMPPKLPEPPEGHSYQWAFEDGDFGVWLYDDEGEICDLPLLG